MKNLLVTGGCGFIGSNFIRYLLKESSCLQDGSSFSENNNGFTGRVINVDKLTYAGNLENLGDIKQEFAERYVFAQADICNLNEMERIFETFQIDSVCHFAAESHVDRSIVSPEIFIDTNVKGTFNLLECSLKQYRKQKSTTEINHSKDDCTKDSSKKDGSSKGDSLKDSSEECGNSFVLFHHISTDEVYGTLGKTGCFTENTPYSPNSPYSASKAASDHLVRAWHETYGLPVTISNCSNNYGPFQFPEKLIPLMILNAIEGKELPVYGDGKNIRDWLYVRDHCVAIWLIMQKGVKGRTYNIGGGHELENRAVVEKICSIIDRIDIASHGVKNDLANLINCNDGDKANKKSNNQQTLPQRISSSLYSTKELIRYVKDRPGHDFRYAIDCTRLKEELGWKPEESFDTGIEKTVKWYLSNLKWVERIKSGEYLRWINTHYA